MGGKPLFRVSAETLINPIFCAMKRHLSNILSLTNAALWNCVGDSASLRWLKALTASRTVHTSQFLSYHLLLIVLSCDKIYIPSTVTLSAHLMPLHSRPDFFGKTSPKKKQTQMRWDKKKKFLLRNPTGEHLTRSSNAAAVLNVTPRDTAGRQQMERAHWGALVVICSYSWRWWGPGETNTSVVLWCYIKLLLSLTEPRTRWTGAAGVSRLQLGSAEPPKWALGISKSKAARGKQAGWTIHAMPRWISLKYLVITRNCA